MFGRMVPGRQRWRRGSLLFLLALGLVLVAATLCLPGPVQAYSAEESALVMQINAHRDAHGLVPLLVSDFLSDSAAKHSGDMGRYGFFSHTTQGSDFFPVGSSPWDRMRLCGYPPAAMGENIAAGSGLTSGAAVFAAWRDSPIHNSQMLNAGFRVIGVSRTYVAGSPYGYYWTADFGGLVDETAHEPASTGTTQATTSTSATTSTTTAIITVPTTTTATTTTTVPTTTTTHAAMPPPPGTTPTTMSWIAEPPAPPVSPFADVPTTHLFYGAICALHASGIMTGYSEGYFGPHDLVKRAQLAKALVLVQGARLDDIEQRSEATFKDVPPNGEVYPFLFVEEAAARGIVEGRADGSFAPYEGVTRAQFALMVVRAGGESLAVPPASYRPGFSDVPEFAAEAVRIACYNGLFAGKTAQVFDPYSLATRGQVAKVLWALIFILDV